MNSNLVFYAVLFASAAVVVRLILWNKKDRYAVESSFATSPEEQYIEGRRGTRMIRLPDGGEMVRPGDIALSPGFGVGEGTFGFGRFGSSFMA